MMTRRLQEAQSERNGSSSSGTPRFTDTYANTKLPCRLALKLRWGSDTNGTRSKDIDLTTGENLQSQRSYIPISIYINASPTMSVGVSEQIQPISFPLTLDGLRQF